VRAIKNLNDVQIVLRGLIDTQQKEQTKALDRNGLQIKNMGVGVDPADAVTLSQLQNAVQPVTAQNQDFTVVFSNAGTAQDGDIFSDYIFGIDRIGHPTAVWIRARHAPTTGVFQVHLTINGNAILNTDIQLAALATGPVFSSNFVSPFPKFGYQSILGGTVVHANSAQIVSIGICIRRDIGS
jgi:hypothetical protein